MWLKKLWIFFLLVASCNYNRHVRNENNPNSPQAEDVVCVPNELEPGQIVDFSQVVEQVFQEKCFGCHAANKAFGGVDLETYTEAKKWASGALFQVENDFMPKAPNPPLSTTEKQIIEAWVLAGAPESTKTQDECNNQDL